MREENKLLIWSWIGILSLVIVSIIGLYLEIDYKYLQKEIFEFGAVMGIVMMSFVVIVTVGFYPSKNM